MAYNCPTCGKAKSLNQAFRCTNCGDVRCTSCKSDARPSAPTIPGNYNQLHCVVCKKPTIKRLA